MPKLPWPTLPYRKRGPYGKPRNPSGKNTTPYVKLKLPRLRRKDFFDRQA